MANKYAGKKLKKYDPQKQAKLKKALPFIIAAAAIIVALIVFVCAKSGTEAGNFTVGTQNPVATITMENGGVITVELYPDIAPNTVANFCELANSGFYDGLIFHRVISGFMIQGGDPNGTGTGGPGYSIKGEFSANGVENNLSHERGVISMARSSAYDSAGSQFFIMHADATYLDGQYAAFGRVTSGMDVVDEIASVSTNSSDKPLTEQKIASIRVELYGGSYKLEKIGD